MIIKKALIVTAVLSTFIFASTRGDVKIIEASENIRYLSQKISKEYLFFYQNPKKVELKDGIYDDIKQLEKSILDIATLTNDKDSKDILDFLEYNKDDIKELIEKPLNMDNSILMLDYSESFLEGANAIENVHTYDFSVEEKMLMALNDVEYLLERATKYYIAYTLKIDKNNNFNNMSQAFLKIERILKEVNNYQYPEDLNKEVQGMNNNYLKYKQFLYKVKNLSIPNLILVTTLNFEKSIRKIALYHKRNQ